MTTTRRALSSLAVLALAAGLMVGCSDKDEPSPSAGSEANASAPVEQSDGGGAGEESTKPNVPKPDPKDYPGMDEHTDEGAEQAFKYFMELALWGYQTGDSSEFKSLYVNETCDACVRTAHEIDETKENGTQWSPVDAETRLEFSDPVTEDSDRYDYEVGYVITLGAHEEDVFGNTKKRNVESVEYVGAGAMDWVGGKWGVAGVKMEKKSNVEAGE
jgi:hypothetical protein